MDLGAAPIAMSLARGEVVDFTMPLWTGRLRIIGGRRELEIDSWGLLLPLTPLVWAITLITLLVVSATLMLPSCFLKGRKMGQGGFRSVRVLLQQGDHAGASCRSLPYVLKVSVLSGAAVVPL